MQDSITQDRSSIAEKPVMANDWRLQETEMLIDELTHLMSRKIGAFEDESVHRELQVLERWRDCCRKGMVTPEAFCETSTVLLTTLHDRLKLAADELHRLEGEGGPPASREQSARTEDLLKAIRHIEKILNHANAHAA